jgi:putative phosphoribosyl transferase
VSRTSPPLPFLDRRQAGALLADALLHLRGPDTVVLAVPRGGVPVARIVADRLGAPLDVVLARKLGAPFNPELAVGAIDETGWVHLWPDAARAGAGSDYLADEQARQRALIADRRMSYRGGRPPLTLARRCVIVVDDGLATGATMIATLHAARAAGPARLVCAVPVASAEALEAVAPWADEVVCLARPREFLGVGQFYVEFDPVSDAQARALLSAPSRAGRASS